MAKERADHIVAAVESRLVDIVLDAVDLTSPHDKFTPVAQVAELEAVERDRVFALALLEGPYAISNRSACRDEILLDIAVRYYHRPLSRARMLRDAPRVRRALRSISSATYGDPRVAIAGDPTCDVSGPRYDYASFADVGWVLARYTARVSYEAEV